MDVNLRVDWSESEVIFIEVAAADSKLSDQDIDQILSKVPSDRTGKKVVLYIRTKNCIPRISRRSRCIAGVVDEVIVLDQWGMSGELICLLLGRLLRAPTKCFLYEDQAWEYMSKLVLSA